jgi:hypothetical protein
MGMAIPTEPIGSIPRSKELIQGMQDFAAGRIAGRGAPTSQTRSAPSSWAVTR